MIRIPQVRVVDEEGAQLGVMPTPQALAMAQERGLDLVEVAPMASPPVVKFLDFGQYKYELTKREKENKRRQRSVTFKEVRLSPKIGSGDFETKVHRAIEFLEEGDRIKVDRPLPRPGADPPGARPQHARRGSRSRIKEHGVAERAPLLEGKSMHLTVASLHKPKEHEAPRRQSDSGDGAAAKPGRAARRAEATAAAAADAGSRRTGAAAAKRPAANGRGGTGQGDPASRPRQRPRPAPPAPGTRRRRRRASRNGRSGADRRPKHRQHRPRQRQESEAQVPKIKSHKAAQKRIGVTGSGKVIRVKAWRGHHLEIKSSRRTRRYAGKALMNGRPRQAGPPPAAVPLGATEPDGTSQARRHRPQAPQAPAERGRGPQGRRSRG